MPKYIGVKFTLKEGEDVVSYGVIFPDFPGIECYAPANTDDACNRILDSAKRLISIRIAYSRDGVPQPKFRELDESTAEAIRSKGKRHVYDTMEQLYINVSEEDIKAVTAQL